jgi:hypothetical protein
MLAAEFGRMKPRSVKLTNTENVLASKNRVMFMLTPDQTLMFVVVVAWPQKPSSWLGPDHVITGAALPRKPMIHSTV